MTQSTYNLNQNQNGTDYNTDVINALKAAITQHKGASRPSYFTDPATITGLWVDDSGDPTWVLYYFDGAQDIKIGDINSTTNVFTPANAAKQDQSDIYALDSSGAANTVVVAPSPAFTAYVTGMQVAIKLANSVTGATTINVNSLGAKTLKKNNSSDIESGDLVANQIIEARYDGTNFQLQSPTIITSSGGLPIGYMQGPPVSFVSTSSIQIPSGFRCRDVDNSADIIFTSAATISIASSGANGLDTGSEAADTWYYVYAIYNPSTQAEAGLLSVTNESDTGSVTLPSGYTKKRQLPIAVRNNGSSNLYDFYVADGWPYRPAIYYDVYQPINPAVSSSEDFIVFYDLSMATTYSDVDASAVIPPISECGIVRVLANNDLNLRPKGASHNGFNPGDSAPGYIEIRLNTNSSQVYEIKGVSGTTDGIVTVAGFVVTEVN